MKFRILKKNSDLQKDTVYFKLEHEDRNNHSILVIVAYNHKGEKISNILTIDEYARCIVLMNGVDEDIGLKTNARTAVIAHEMGELRNNSEPGLLSMLIKSKLSSHDCDEDDHD